MAEVNVFFNESYQKKNGECAVYLTVHIDYKTLKINTGVSCKPAAWDVKKLRVKGTGKTATDKNLIIEQKLASINEIFVRYRLQNLHLTTDALKNELKNPARRIDFYAFFDEAIAERKKDIADGTYRGQKSVIAKMKRFSPELSFSEITPDFIESFRRWLRSAKVGNDINTIHRNMKVLKTYLQIAVRKGIIDKNPFYMVRLKQAKPTRVYLDEPELMMFWEKYNTEEMSNTWRKVLRHFLFMCFTGLRVSDLKKVKKTEIYNNVLQFTPQKTKREKKEGINMPLNSYALKLIADEDSKSEFLFNPMTDQRMNIYLKEMAGAWEINKDLSNHSGRHTFATLWLKKTKDLPVLQKLLGHSLITQTMEYVHITPEDIRNQMQNLDKTLFSSKKSPDHRPGD